jgi:hypothetical protein
LSSPHPFPTNTNMAKYFSSFAHHMICRDAVLVQKVIDGKVVTEPEAPEAIRFIDGQYETTDPSLIEFLDNHRHNGTTFHRAPDEVVKAEPDVDCIQVEDIETINAAVEYLVETFGVSPDKLKSKKAVLAIAKDNGIEFPNLA